MEDLNQQIKQYIQENLEISVEKDYDGYIKVALKLEGEIISSDYFRINVS